MRTKFMIFFLLLFVAIVGCTNYQPAPIHPQEPAPVEQEVQEVPVAEPESPQVPKVQPKVESPPEVTPVESSFEQLPIEQQRKIKFVRKLIDDARAREENYFFRYSDENILQTDVWAKGNVVKRAMIRLDEVDKSKPYNIVYLYQITKTAQAYCETTKSACPLGHGPGTESFSKWNIKTPKDWLLELDNDFLWTLDNKVNDVLYHIIDFKKDGKLVRVYINDYQGWPGKVEIRATTDPDSKITAEYVYDDMDIGGVSDEDVTPGGTR